MLVQSGTDPQRGVSFVAFKRLVQQIAQMGPQYRREEKGKPKKRKRPQMREEMSRTAWKLFKQIDVDGSGDLDVSEMFGAVKLLGISASKGKVFELIREVDQSGSNELDF